MDLLPRYLEAVGLPEAAASAPDLELLGALLERHVAAFPYETLGMGLGDPYPLETRACVERTLAGRPGYCYTQNTTFAWVLASLGFDVTRHLGTVTGRGKPEPEAIGGGHMALTVTLGGQTFLADAGLGPGPAAPLPLVPGTHPVDGFAHRVEPSPVPGAAWRLVLDPATGGFRTMDFCAAASPHEDFVPLHEGRRHIGDGTGPYFTVMRPDRGTVPMLVGVTYREHSPGGAAEPRVLRECEAWVAQVEALGCRALQGRPEGAVQALHARLVREHDAFHA